MSNLKKTTLIKYLNIFIFTVILAGSLSIVLVEDIRNSVRSSFYKNTRMILSSATADLLNNGSSVKVLKIRKGNMLIIEVYGSSDTGVRPLISSFNLPDQNDGYFHIQGQATNLALKDIDGDEVMEILVPTFDENMVAHLNVYKYNPLNKDFDPVKP